MYVNKQLTHERVEFPKTPHQYQLLRLALETAYKDQAVFTKAAFAQRHNLKDNRHLSEALNAMVSGGILMRMNVMFADSRPRDVYARLPFSSDTEQLNRVAQQINRYAAASGVKS